jgi:hypothetical protein
MVWIAGVKVRQFARGDFLNYSGRTEIPERSMIREICDSEAAPQRGRDKTGREVNIPLPPSDITYCGSPDSSASDPNCRRNR